METISSPSCQVTLLSSAKGDLRRARLWTKSISRLGKASTTKAGSYCRIGWNKSSKEILNPHRRSRGSRISFWGKAAIWEKLAKSKCNSGPRESTKSKKSASTFKSTALQWPIARPGACRSTTCSSIWSGWVAKIAQAVSNKSSQWLQNSWIWWSITTHSKKICFRSGLFCCKLYCNAAKRTFRKSEQMKTCCNKFWFRNLLYKLSWREIRPVAANFQGRWILQMLAMVDIPSANHLPKAWACVLAPSQTRGIQTPNFPSKHTKLNWDSEATAAWKWTISPDTHPT